MRAAGRGAADASPVPASPGSRLEVPDPSVAVARLHVGQAFPNTGALLPPSSRACRAPETSPRVSLHSGIFRPRDWATSCASLCLFPMPLRYCRGAEAVPLWKLARCLHPFAVLLRCRPADPCACCCLWAASAGSAFAIPLPWQL